MPPSARPADADTAPPTRLEQTVRALVRAHTADEKLDTIGCCIQLNQLLEDHPERTVPDAVLLLLTPEMRQTALIGMCLIALDRVGGVRSRRGSKGTGDAHAAS